MYKLLLGYPTKIHCEDMGKIIGSERLGEHYVFVKGDWAYYYDEISGEIIRCRPHNIRRQKTLGFDSLNQFPAPLLDRFRKSLEGYFKDCSSPTWFQCRFVRLRRYELDYNTEKLKWERINPEVLFAVYAKNCFYRITSSNTCERFVYKKQEIEILEEFGEGEVPPGLEYMLPLLTDIQTEVKEEFEKYKILKAVYERFFSFR